MYNFHYYRAIDVADAASKLLSLQDPKLLAGGMTLLPTLKNRLAAPTDLVDLGAIEELRGISVEGKEIVIRAMTPHATVAASTDVKRVIPALAVLAGNIGDPAVRHRGTIGGSVANSDPAADYPACCVGLDATLETNLRKIPAEEFFVGLFETALQPGEIITAVRFRTPDYAKYMKFRHPASGYAVVGVMVARFGMKVRVAVTGAGPFVFRVKDMEAALDESFNPESITDIKVSPENFMDDIHFSAEYRAHLITVYARRAVEELAR